MKNVHAKVETVVKARANCRIPTAAVDRRSICSLLEWIQRAGDSRRTGWAGYGLPFGVTKISRNSIGAVQHMIELEAHFVVGIY